LRVAISIAVVVCAAAPQALAYDFAIDVRTIGQGYQVRGFAPDGSTELLSRRRLTQYLDLAVFDLGPAGWRGDDGTRNVFYFDASVRLDADFGGYMLGAPGGAAAIPELKQSELDILYAYVGARNLGGRLDLQLGRQIHIDLVDFYALDGADLVLHLSRLVALEALAGTEALGDYPLGSPIYQLDGTSPGSRDPATRPDQSSAIKPMAGAAIAVGPPGGAYAARLSFREVWSATADRLPGEPASGVNFEAASLTASATWRRLSVSGGLRYNILFGEFDDEQLAVRLRLTSGQWLTLEHDYLAPTFDGDSIWNVFATGAYRDLRASYEVALPRGMKAYARGFVRFYQATSDEVATVGPYAGQDVGATAQGGRVGGGGSLGAAWRSARGMARADAYWDDGYGGRKLGVDATTRLRIRRPFELEGRATGYRWNDEQPTTGGNSGVVFGLQAGGRFQLGPGVRLHLLLEDNFGTMYESQFRGLAMVELDAGL
jgi:hypothetical protein